MLEAITIAILFAGAIYISWQAHSPPRLVASWLVPVVILLGLGFYVADPPLDYVLIIVAAAIYLGMVTSDRIANLWTRLVMGWDEPWLRGELPPADDAFYQAIRDIIASVHAIDSQRYAPGAKSRTEELRGTLASIEELDPPTTEWEGLRRQVAEHVASVLEVYTTAATSDDGGLIPSPATHAELDASWRRTIEQLLKVRGDRTVAF